MCRSTQTKLSIVKALLFWLNTITQQMRTLASSTMTTAVDDKYCVVPTLELRMREYLKIMTSEVVCRMSTPRLRYFRYGHIYTTITIKYRQSDMQDVLHGDIVHRILCHKAILHRLIVFHYN